jgi:hypothetical protein
MGRPRAEARSRLDDPRRGRRRRPGSTSDAAAGVLETDRRGHAEQRSGCRERRVDTGWDARFRDGGGMPSISLAEPSRRYLLFAEREEMAILKAQACGHARDRTQSEPSSFDDLARAAGNVPRAASWSTARRPRSGRLSGRRDGPRFHGRPADRRWGVAWSPEQTSRRLRIDFPVRVDEGSRTRRPNKAPGP